MLSGGAAAISFPVSIVRSGGFVTVAGKSHLISGIQLQSYQFAYRFLVWPLLSLAILITTAVPAVQIFWTCFLSCVMAIMAVVGAMVRSDYKWGK